MSQRSLFDVGVSNSKKRKLDESDQSKSVESPAKKVNSSDAKTRSFQKSWLSQFDWLEYDSEV